MEAVDYASSSVEQVDESLTIGDFLGMVEDQEAGLAHTQQSVAETLLQEIDNTGSRLRLYEHAVAAIQEDVSTYREQLAAVRAATTQLHDGYGTVIAGLQTVRQSVQSQLVGIERIDSINVEARQEAVGLRSELKLLSDEISKLEAEYAQCAKSEFDPGNDADKVYLTGFFETYGQWPSQLKAAELAELRGRFGQARDRLLEIEKELLPTNAAQRQAAMAAIEDIVTCRWQALVGQARALEGDNKKIEASLAMVEMRVLARMQSRLQELGGLVARHTQETDLGRHDTEQGEHNG